MTNWLQDEKSGDHNVRSDTPSNLCGTLRRSRAEALQQRWGAWTFHIKNYHWRLFEHEDQNGKKPYYWHQEENKEPLSWSDTRLTTSKSIRQKSKHIHDICFHCDSFVCRQIWVGRLSLIFQLLPILSKKSLEFRSYVTPAGYIH